MTGTGSSDVGAFGPTLRVLEALNYTSKTTRNSRSRSTALHVRCATTYHHSHCSRPLVRCREAESAVSKDLIELPSTGSKRQTYATRPNVSYLRLPRQPASANGATTPGFSGPFPSQCVDAAHADTRVPICSWQLGSFLIGVPARGPSRPLLVGFWVAALPHSTIARWQEATDPQSPGGR